MSTQTHPGELLLRRLRSGELSGAEHDEVKGHTAACAHCRTRLRSFDEEQRRFEAEIPWDRFRAGVRRAQRPARWALPRRAWAYPGLAAAALVTLMVSAGPLTRLFEPATEHTWNRTKGGADMSVVVSSRPGGPQREAVREAPEPLGPGETVRIGYRAGERRYVMAISIDEDGIVSALHPERGPSVPVSPAEDGRAWLPAVEFTGEGAEHIVLILTDSVLDPIEVERAALRAFEAAGGDPSKLGRLELPGEQFHQTVLKP